MSSHLRRISVNDLTLLVGKKRCEKERIKRHKVEEALEELESSNLKPIGEPDHLFLPYNNGCIVRSSWLQRKSNDTLRLMSDSWTTSYEVTIKLLQRKKNINCLLYASKALDENPDS